MKTQSSRHSKQVPFPQAPSNSIKISTARRKLKPASNLFWKGLVSIWRTVTSKPHPNVTPSLSRTFSGTHDPLLPPSKNSTTRWSLCETTNAGLFAHIICFRCGSNWPLPIFPEERSLVLASSQDYLMRLTRCLSCKKPLLICFVKGSSSSLDVWVLA